MSLLRLIIVATIIILHAPWTVETALGQQAQSARPKFSTPEQMQEDINAVPCKSSTERLKAVRALFEKMGAPASDISIENRNNVENIIVRKQGSTPEIIVIGAHYDKVSSGCGVVDNWTGIVTMAHIYRTIKDIPLKKSVLFVGFGREEEGLVGSKEWVKSISKEQVGQYCAMINIDSTGMGMPQALSGSSSEKLITRAEELAKRMQMPFKHSAIFEADSDSTSFLKKKIPAISIHALSSDWRKVLHTNDDMLSKINMASVYAGYKLSLALYGEVENSACDAFR